MEQSIELIKIVVEFLGIPLSIIGTFLITRYTSNRNRPLDNYNLAYDKIYYPISCLIQKREELSTEQLIAQIQHIIKANYKYINLTTVITFKEYQRSVEKNLSQRVISNKWEKFDSDILRNSEFLRFRLGYLVPSYYSIYKTMAVKDRKIIVILFTMAMIYILFAIYTICINKPIITNTLGIFIMLGFCIVIWNTFILILVLICDWFKNILEKVTILYHRVGGGQ